MAAPVRNSATEAHWEIDHAKCLPEEMWEFQRFLLKSIVRLLSCNMRALCLAASPPRKPNGGRAGLPRKLLSRKRRREILLLKDGAVSLRQSSGAGPSRRRLRENN